MFTTKRKLKQELIEANRKIDKLEIELEDFKKENEFLKESNGDLRNEIEEEHLENYNQHKVLLNINKLIENTADGTYISILNITKAIKKELSTIFK